MGDAGFWGVIVTIAVSHSQPSHRRFRVDCKTHIMAMVIIKSTEDFGHLLQLLILADSWCPLLNRAGFFFVFSWFTRVEAVIAGVVTLYPDLEGPPDFRRL